MNPNLSKTPYLFIGLLIFLANMVQAQNNTPKKYPALLWEITGNGLEKPSYLYGTMHVSNKIAFHLGDTFFMALKNCDMVALESDPSFWLDEMLDSIYLEENGGLYRRQNYHRDFYRDAFNIEEIDKKTLSSSLTMSSRMMNGMLYRNSNYNADFEEETYLDMYIFQAGKKLNKTVIGLEDFLEADRLVRQSNIPDEDADDQPRNKDYRKIIKQGKSPGEMLEDAYRNEDLDMVDSIQRIMSPSKNHQKFMLHDRNVIMAHRMDSIIQENKSLFSGIGAAHLAGNMGVIELMRAKGYTMRPVVRKINQYSKDFRDTLEKTYVKLPLHTFSTPDGWISVDLPNKMYSFPSFDNYKMYFYPEMSNGTNYSLTRLRHRGPMVNQSKEYIKKRIDSLLYENIPGKIIVQNEIVRNGYPGFDIINRTKKSDYERYLILVTPLEVIIFKVGGTLDYIIDNNNLDDVFSSFTVQNKPNISQTFHSKYGFDVEIKGTPICEEKDNNLDAMIGNEVFIESMDADSNYFCIRRTSLHDFNYIEEDTFELSYIANQFQDLRKLKERSRELTRFKGYPAIKTSCSDSLRFVHSLYFIDGPRYYQMLAKTNDSIWPEAYFSSFTKTEAIQLRPNRIYTDTSSGYSVSTNTKPAGYRSFDLYDIKKEQKKKKEEDRGYEGEYENWAFCDLLSDQQMSLTYRKFSRYYYYPSYDSLWRTYKTFYKNRDMVLSNMKISTDSSHFSYTLSDTNSVRAILYNQKIHGNTMYGYIYIKDTTQKENNPFINEFIASFKPINGAYSGLAFNENKAGLFFDDLLGTDSLAREYALSSLSAISFKDEHAPQIISVIETFKYKNFNTESKTTLIRELGYLKHKLIVPYLDKVYRRSVDTASIQTAVLRALAYQKTKSAARKFKELLAYETPLVTEYEIKRMFNPISDSLELHRDLFPFLLQYTYYPEYKTNVYTLMANMLDSGIFKPKHYKKFRKNILREAKDQVKRNMAGNTSSNNRDRYRDYSNEYSTEADAPYIGSFTDIYYYNKMLFPYKNEKDVQEYFNRIRRLNDKTELLSSSLQMLQNTLDVNDSIWGYYASKDEHRYNLYTGLKAIGQLTYYPDSLLSQEHMARAILYRNKPMEDEDSVQFVKKMEARLKGRKGYIYVFKHKDSYNENEWEYDYIGLQPLDSMEYNFKSDLSRKGIDFIDNELMDKTLKEAIEVVIYEDRKRVKGKNGNNRYDYYNDY